MKWVMCYPMPDDGYTFMYVHDGSINLYLHAQSVEIYSLAKFICPALTDFKEVA